MALDAPRVRLASRAILPKHGEVTGSKVIQHLLFDESNPGSVNSCDQHGAQ